MPTKKAKLTARVLAWVRQILGDMRGRGPHLRGCGPHHRAARSSVGRYLESIFLSILYSHPSVNAICVAAE